LVAAFVEDLTEVVRHQAASSPGARLDPPILLALDEIGNLAPLPSLPVLMAEGGGTGIPTMPVLQSLSQARSKWGDHATNTIWDASIVKVILGGASASKDLQELSVLIGERDEYSAFWSSRASFNIACARRAKVRSATTVLAVSMSQDACTRRLAAVLSIAASF
jgi:type IV secretory pathway TraG/TraD family ATPase VirD4